MAKLEWWQKEIHTSPNAAFFPTNAAIKSVCQNDSFEVKQTSEMIPCHRTEKEDGMSLDDKQIPGGRTFEIRKR